MLEYRFLDIDAEIRQFRSNLPHWRQEGTIYYITYRLADSLPQEKLDQWYQERDQWYAAHPPPWDEEAYDQYMQRFPAQIERWLDQGSGRCVLRDPHLSSIVGESLGHGHGTHYLLDRWVVMPNHVHALVCPLPGTELSTIIQTWKSYTALEINRWLGEEGSLWQKESFDHIVRSPAHLERFRKYIHDNPRRTMRIDAPPQPPAHPSPMLAHCA